MNLPSSVTKSLFHQLVITFIPGSLVVIPFLVAVYISPSNRGFISFFTMVEKTNIDHFAIYAVSTILIFLIGLILENIGSKIEDEILDNNKNNMVNLSAWRYYLFSECGDQKIRVYHKYVDSIVFRYKFELSLIPALIIFSFEWVWILCEEYTNIPGWFIILISLIIICTFWFTCKQANVSCKYLNDLRIAFMAATYKENDKLVCEKCTKIVSAKRCNVCGVCTDCSIKRCISCGEIKN